MRIAMTADHAGMEMKDRLYGTLRDEGHDVVDLGPFVYDADDDYPDFVIPLAERVAAGEFERGICVCGSGIGASIAANKVAGARAAQVLDAISARSGVEEHDVNVLCLGSRLTEFEAAWPIVLAFLDARYAARPRRQRQMELIAAIERGET